MERSKNSKVKPLFSYMLLLSIAILLIGISLTMYKLVIVDRNAQRYDNGKLYLRMVFDSNPLNLPDREESLDMLDHLWDELDSIDNTQYMVINYQPINSPKAEGATCKFINSNSQAMEISPEYCKATQISSIVQDYFELSVSSGRLLEPTDFEWNGGTIPVLLGYVYGATHYLGEVFNADYLYSNYQFEVVGILEKGTVLRMSFGSASLDNSVVMPAFSYNVSPVNNEEYVTQKIHRSICVSGLLVTDNNNLKQTATSIDKIIRRYNGVKISYYSTLYCFPLIKSGLSPSLLAVILSILGVLINCLLMGKLIKKKEQLKNASLVILGSALVSSVGLDAIILVFKHLVGVTITLSFCAMGILAFDVLSLFVFQERYSRKQIKELLP